MSPFTKEQNKTVVTYEGYFDTSDSSVFESVYKLDEETVAFLFRSGSTYRYNNIPESVMTEIFDPEISLGAYYAQNIRGVYHGDRLGWNNDLEFVPAEQLSISYDNSDQENHVTEKPTFGQGLSYAALMKQYVDEFDSTRSEEVEETVEEESFVVNITMSTGVSAADLVDFIEKTLERNSVSKVEIVRS
jgi:hypothetical protein